MSGCVGGACPGRAPWQWAPEAQHGGRAPRRPACPPTSSSALSSCRVRSLASEPGTILVVVLRLCCCSPKEDGASSSRPLRRAGYAEQAPVCTSRHASRPQQRVAHVWLCRPFALGDQASTVHILRSRACSTGTCLRRLACSRTLTRAALSVPLSPSSCGPAVQYFADRLSQRLVWHDPRHRKAQAARSCGTRPTSRTPKLAINHGMILA